MNIFGMRFGSKVSSPVRAAGEVTAVGAATVLRCIRGRRSAASAAGMRGGRGGDSFPGVLRKMIEEKCSGDAGFVCRRSGFDRRSYRQIAGGASVSKRAAMQFAIGLQLTRDEADRLLDAADFSFSDSEPEDVAFGYCLDNRMWNLRDLNVILRSCGMSEICLPEGY